MIKRGRNDNDAWLTELAWGVVIVEPMLVPRTIRQDTHHCKQTGAFAVFGRVTGWRFLIIASLISYAPCYSSTNISYEALAN